VRNSFGLSPGHPLVVVDERAGHDAASGLSITRSDREFVRLGELSHRPRCSARASQSSVGVVEFLLHCSLAGVSIPACHDALQRMRWGAIGLGDVLGEVGERGFGGE